MLTQSELNKIKEMLYERQQLQPISVILPSLQEPANKMNIYQLQRYQLDNYYLIPKVMSSNSLSDVNGRFIFVIKANEPGVIYCAKAFDQLNRYLSDNKRGIEGHTSLTKRKDVLFAGSLIFNNKELVSWSNDSGHYQPKSELRHINLLPHIKMLLPETLYIPISFDQLSTGQHSVASSGRMNDFSSIDSTSSNSSYKWPS
ncbi:Uncharacterised protein [Buttiauxella agrestis]|uniref:Uncharacterized protein n=1 Tax=Buttiauxella agrestis TaxID=82977 RepID=A0A381CD98_9ENTR|nr:hypothetical protein [Buttiauxella agrestis]SUW65836.1 Uncharacterised protein [Buttiauxella agrestis]